MAVGDTSSSTAAVPPSGLSPSLRLLIGLAAVAIVILFMRSASSVISDTPYIRPAASSALA